MGQRRGGGVSNESREGQRRSKRESRATGKDTTDVKESTMMES